MPSLCSRRLRIRRALRLIGWNAFLLVLGVVLVAMAGEAYFRLTVPFMASSDLREFVPNVGVLRPPNTELRFTNGRDYWNVSRTNSLGFLDREPPSIERAAATCHISMIGDSFVEAREVPIDDKFHVRLEELAAPHLNITTSAFGRGNTGQIQQLPFYDAYARLLHPQLLVLVFVPNDFIDNSPVLRALAHEWELGNFPEVSSSGFRVGRLCGQGFTSIEFPPPLRERDREGGTAGLRGGVLYTDRPNPFQPSVRWCWRRWVRWHGGPPTLTLPLKGGGNRSSPQCRTKDGKVRIGPHRVGGKCHNPHESLKSPEVSVRRRPDEKMELLPPRASRVVRSGEEATETSWFALWLRTVWDRINRKLFPRNQAFIRRVETLRGRPGYAALLEGWKPINKNGFLRTFARRDLPPVFAEALEYTAFALEQFKERAERDGAKLVILATSKMKERAFGTRVFGRMSEIAAALGIPVIDQADYIVRQGAELEDARWRHDAHWSVTGHRWAAEALLEYLKEHRAICNKPASAASRLEVP